VFNKKEIEKIYSFRLLNSKEFVKVQDERSAMFIWDASCWTVYV